MLTKIAGAIVISVVSVVTTLLVQSIISAHGTSAAGKPHQTQPPGAGACTTIHGNRMVGTVDSVGTNSFTLTNAAGKSITINVSATTKYRGENASASFNDLHKGVVVIVAGTAGSNNTFNATTVAIVPPHAAGKVTGINGGTLTVQPPTGALGRFASSVTTVHTTGSTKYIAPMSGTTGFNAIKVGSYIAATGTLNNDGSMTATRIIIAPEGFAPRNFGIGQHLYAHGQLQGFLSRMRYGGWGAFHGFQSDTGTAPGTTA